jgi:hypothetical protein
MGRIHPIRNVLRIDNVETAPAERITANDEDRQRQGFDIQTVFAWPRREGAIDVATAVARDEVGPILLLSYGHGATISRLNKGLRRRKEKSIFGFVIDPATGRWVGSRNEGDDDDPTTPAQQRVVPIVQDNKNALLLRLPGAPLSEMAIATLQHALARGLEIVFQLEEGEVSTEPVPSRERRRAILLYEATEGGAGVLGRLTTDPAALPRVARKALELMHFENIDTASTAAAPDALAEDSNARCVAGCYRCLLSYYNQPDHELINRTDRDVQLLLLRLARGNVIADQTVENDTANGDWPAAIARWGLPNPDPEPLTLDGATLPLTCILQQPRSDRLIQRLAPMPRLAALSSLCSPRSPETRRRANSSNCLGTRHDRNIRARRIGVRARTRMGDVACAGRRSAPSASIVGHRGRHTIHPPWP